MQAATENHYGLTHYRESDVKIGGKNRHEYVMNPELSWMLTTELLYFNYLW